MRDPDRYVLKPQREGGGNNVYGEDIRPFLASIRDSDERSAYILMDRIHPPKTKNYMVRPGAPAQFKQVISELGIFGYIIGYVVLFVGLCVPFLSVQLVYTRDSKKIVTNRQVGHMLRTKLSDVNEGGVAAGLGALDSVILVDVNKCCVEPGNCEAKDCCNNKDGCC